MLKVLSYSKGDKQGSKGEVVSHKDHIQLFNTKWKRRVALSNKMMEDGELDLVASDRDYAWKVRLCTGTGLAPAT